VSEEAGMGLGTEDRSVGGQMKTKQGPDLIYIGMQIAATGRLYQQLKNHVELLMLLRKGVALF